MMRPDARATLLGLCAVGLWSTVATAFKYSLKFLSPIQLLLGSSAVSLITLGAALAAQGRLADTLRHGRATWRRAALLGLVNPCLYYLILFKAYALLPAQEAQPLNYTWAVTLSLLSVPMLGQRLAWRDMAALLVSYAGVLVIATRGDVASLSFASPLGVGLALGSTLLWALYWILGVKDDREPVAGLFWNFVFGTLFVLIAAVFTATPLPRSLPGLLGAAYVGVFEMGLTFVLWLSALKATANTSRVANLIFLSPFLSLVFIHFLLGEDIRASTFAGLGLIMAGLAVQRLGKTP